MLRNDDANASMFSVQECCIESGFVAHTMQTFIRDEPKPRREKAVDGRRVGTFVTEEAMMWAKGYVA